jgi:hypothetical protein
MRFAPSAGGSALRCGPHTIQPALDALDVGWHRFADAVAAGDLDAAERWAQFTFGLFETLDAVDLGWGERWTARAVHLVGADLDDAR